MPQCAQLKTFREPRDRLTAARELSYFHWWNLLSFRAWSILGLIVLLSALAVDYKRGGQDTPLTLFAVSLYIVGTAMVLLNCFFAQLQPRYILPMMELLLLSLMILIAVLFKIESSSRYFFEECASTLLVTFSASLALAARGLVAACVSLRVVLTSPDWAARHYPITSASAVVKARSPV